MTSDYQVHISVFCYWSWRESLSTISSSSSSTFSLSFSSSFAISLLKARATASSSSSAVVWSHLTREFELLGLYELKVEKGKRLTPRSLKEGLLSLHRLKVSGGIKEVNPWIIEKRAYLWWLALFFIDSSFNTS